MAAEMKSEIQIKKFPAKKPTINETDREKSAPHGVLAMETRFIPPSYDATLVQRKAKKTTYNIIEMKAKYDDEGD